MRPGGRVVVLEITTPQRPPLSLFYRAVVRPRRARARPRSRARSRRASGARPPSVRRLGPTRRRRLRVPAELGPALPRARGARRGDGGRRSRRHRLPAHRRGDRRDPPRHRAGAGGRDEHARQPRARRAGPRDRRARRGHAPRRRGAAPPDGAHGAPPRARHRRGGRAAGLARERHDRRRAASACARCWCCSRRSPPEGRRARADGRGAARARGGGGRARALGHARPRRPDRRRAAAPRASHGGRGRGARGGGRDRRPAVLAGVRRARAQRRLRAAERAVGGELGARRRRAPAARGRLRARTSP